MRTTVPMILVRIVVGLVFLSEGLLKFLQADVFGANWFTALGWPMAQTVAPSVGCVEIVGGLALLLNFYAGEAAIALAVIALTAFITADLPLALGHPVGPFVGLRGETPGLAGFLHAARMDVAMLFCSVATLIDRGLQIGQRRKWYQDKH